MKLTRYAVRDVAELYDGPHATPAPADDGPVFLGIGNITPEGRLDLSDVRHIAEEEFGRWTRRVLPSEGDLVFTYEATLHRYAKIPPGFRGCLGRRTALLRLTSDAAHGPYLLYYFLSPVWRAQVEQNILPGATVERIPLTRVPDFTLDLPELAEQRRIADVLAAYDDLIAANERRMALLEESVHLLYREWFQRRRYPGHEWAPARDGLPEGWTNGVAGDAIDFAPRTAVRAGAEAPFVPMSSLSTFGMTIEPIELRIPSGGARFQNGDTLLARITPCLENGKTGYVQFLAPNETGTGSTEFIVMRGRRVPATWVYCLARSDAFRKYAVNHLTGSDGRQRVSADELAAFPLVLPSESVLDDWRRVADPRFAAVHAMARHNAKLREARDYLLPRLLSGRLAA